MKIALSRGEANLTTNGDVFQIYYTCAAVDQVGRGSGDLIRGDGPPNGTIYNQATGTNSWPRQVSEPLYYWDNTADGVSASVVSGYANVIDGRDIINSIKPGYIPLAYPHSLDQ